ncbi:hypothetical protein [Tardiphaga sp.]|uniref:hypothetical protein n=1 Tax=Tardiphaga sp. TaxID=1926292 RepID=UPI0026340D40|nr:hypothetical protein [Tardiphaga sp.]MDB5617431.1 hypothetical protein [Tardiphaga sp.]
MKSAILIVVVLLVSPALAQNKPAPVRADPCAPIGRTADGKLVYSMKCDNLPAPPPPPPAPVEEESKGGLFRNPFPSLIRPSSGERTPGLGPACAGP